MRRILLGWLAGLALLLPLTAQAAETRVRDRAELMTALSSAGAGDTLTLAAGRYGDVFIRGARFDRQTILRSETPGGAVFDSLAVVESSFLRFEGLHVSHPTNGERQSKVVRISDSEKIALLGCEVNGRADADFSGHFAVHVTNTAGVRVVGNAVHDVKHGIIAFNSQDVIMADNRLERIGEDSFKFSGVTGLLVQNNIGPSLMFPQKGAHDDFIQFQGAGSSNVTLRGNLFLPQNSTHAQGIFVGKDILMTDVLIEQNIIATSMLRAISLDVGSNITIQDNTIIGLPGPHGVIAKVIAPEGSVVRRNIWSGDTPNRQNYIVNGTGAYARLFVDANWGDAPRLEDLVPKPGSAAASIGAIKRLTELQGKQ